jgi:hypothetical protein
LNVVRFIAALIARGRVSRDVREPWVFPLEEETSSNWFNVESDSPEFQEGFPVGACIPAKTGLAHPVLCKTVEVEIGLNDLGSACKSLRFRQEVSVFIDHGVTVPGKVGR